jgi:hypothetical protein
MMAAHGEGFICMRGVEDDNMGGAGIFFLAV